MKNKIIAVFVFLSVSANMSAQFTNTSLSGGNNEGWESFWLQWNPSSFNLDDSDLNKNFTGISLGYSKAFSVSPSIPIFVEVGGGIQFSFFSDDEYDVDDYYYDYDAIKYESKFKMLSLKVPVRFLYNFQIPNSTLQLSPYVGLTTRFNILAQEKSTIGKSVEENIDYFDKKDMEGDTWNRFQIGWEIGLQARFKSLLLGVSYGTDFSEIADKTKIHTTSVTLGVFL